MQLSLFGFDSLCYVPECAGDCVGTYKKCAGNIADGAQPCCKASDHCLMKSSYYSQCRPRQTPVPEDWDGSVVECGGFTPEGMSINTL